MSTTKDEAMLNRGRIRSRKRALQMLGRLAGLRSAKKQRRLGWPNLKKATAARRRYADRRRLWREFQRLADIHGLTPEVREEIWEYIITPEPKQRSLIGERGVPLVDLRARGMSLLEARRRGLVR
jgi:hypothetical protein